MQARDLAVLAAAAYKRKTGQLRVLDIMAGSGVRGVRYMKQAGADEVWSNDMDTRNRGAMLRNAHTALGACCSTEDVPVAGLRGVATTLTQAPQADGVTAPALRIARVSHFEAKRLLCAAMLEEDYYDVIDCDMFGSDTLCIGPALDAVRFGGLLYLTGTDGFSSGGAWPRCGVHVHTRSTVC